MIVFSCKDFDKVRLTVEEERDNDGCNFTVSRVSGNFTYEDEVFLDYQDLRKLAAAIQDVLASEAERRYDRQNP